MMIVCVSLMFILMNFKYEHALEENRSLKKQILQNEMNYGESLEVLREKYDNVVLDYGIVLNEKESLESEVKTLKSRLQAHNTTSYSEAELILLAKCVKAEAGSSDKSQKMVTQVILNRVKSKNFPNSITEVIYEKHGSTPQFSVAYNGALNKQVVDKNTLKNVKEVLERGYPMPSSVQYFYASSLRESNWVKSLKIYQETDGTIFAFTKER